MTTEFENTPRTLATALGLWALAVAVGSLAGVFVQLPDAENAAIALFGFFFGLIAVHIDRELAALMARVSTRTLLTIAIEANLGIVLALMLATGFAEGSVASALERLLAGLAVLFAAPVAAVVHVLLAERLLKPRRISSRVARGPASPPAAA